MEKDYIEVEEIVEEAVEENFFRRHKNKILIGLGVITTAGLAALLIGKSNEKDNYIDNTSSGELDSIDYSKDLIDSEEETEK